MRDDWSTLRKLMFQHMAGGGSLKEYEAEGNPVAFNTNVQKPLSAFTIPFLPVQNLNGQSAPYPPGGGKNLVDWVGPRTITTQTVIVRLDTSEQVVFTASVTAINNASINGALNLYAYNGNTLVQSKQTPILANTPSARYNVTLDLSDATYDNIRISISGASAGYSLTISDAQLEKGETATPFAPYSNVCPISGWTGAKVSNGGADVFNKSTAKNNTRITASGAEYYESGYYASDFIPVNVGLSYEKNSPILDAYHRMCSYDSNRTFVRLIGDSNNITIQSGEAYIRFCGLLSEKETAHLISNVVSHEIPFSTEVYGGTLDAVNGVLTVEWAAVDLGSLTWNRYSVSQGTLFRTTIPDSVAVVASQKAKALCSAYPTVPQISRAERTLSANGKDYDIIDSNYSDATSFKSAVSGQTICYPLATPIEIPMSAISVTTLLGNNTIWSDTNGVNAVKYKKKG